MEKGEHYLVTGTPSTIWTGLARSPSAVQGLLIPGDPIDEDDDCDDPWTEERVGAVLHLTFLYFVLILIGVDLGPDAGRAHKFGVYPRLF